MQADLYTGRTTVMSMQVGKTCIYEFCKLKFIIKIYESHYFTS